MRRFDDYSFDEDSYMDEHDEEEREKRKDRQTKMQNLIINGVSAAVVLIVVLVLCITNIYFLNQDEFAVVTTFGEPHLVDNAGPHFTIPFIQKEKKYQKSTMQFTIGYEIDSQESIVDESVMITKDMNFINVDFYFNYHISDPIQFQYASQDALVIMRNLAQSYIRDTVGAYNIDDVMTTGKIEIQSKIEDALKKRMNDLNLGISIDNVTIQDSEPPTQEVQAAFNAVEDARQQMEVAINKAKADQNTKIPDAEAKADAIVKDAEAEKAATIADAQGQVARFNTLYEEYVNFPLVTKKRMYYETMEKLLPNMKIYISDGETQKLLPLEPFSQTQQQ